MEKVKIRYVEELINVLPNHFNIKIIKILNGGWLNFSTYQCIKCGEIFVTKSLDDNYLLLNKKNIQCPNCETILNDTLIKYPERILLNGKVIYTNINMDYISNVDNSKISEFYLLSDM